MSAWYEHLLDGGHIPDAVLRFGIRRQLASRLRQESRGGEEAEQRRRRNLLDELRSGPIARHTRNANLQHYEVPPEFFAAVLGEPGVARRPPLAGSPLIEGASESRATTRIRCPPSALAREVATRRRRAAGR